MKNSILLLCFMASLSVANTQQYKVAHNTGKIIINELSNVLIEGYDGTEVLVNSKTRRNEEEDSRRKGLKLINSAGLEDNTGVGINVTKEGQNLKITKIENCEGDPVVIKVPKGLGIEYTHKSIDGDEVEIKGITGEIEVSANYPDVILTNVTGPMAVKTIYGKIEATFAQIAQTGSITLSSAYELVDITIPTSAKYNLNVNTPYGNIYSGVSIDVQKDNDAMRNVSSRRLNGTVNGGGVEITLKSGYENVYIRN